MASPHFTQRLVNLTPDRQANGFRLFSGKVPEISGSEVMADANRNGSTEDAMERVRKIVAATTENVLRFIAPR